MQRPLPYLGLAIVMAALGVRLGYWSLVERDPSKAIYEFHLVQGQPYADAFFWDRLAIRLAAGEGASGTGWEARRPFYAYFLATIYAWTGPRYAVAQAVNIALGVFTVWLLFDLTRRLAGQAAALVVGLWAAWHPTAVCLSLITLTETLGWALIVWHVQQAVRAVAQPRPHAWRCGLLFAASNLTRTLTLFILPGVVLWLSLLCRRAGSTWSETRRAGLSCALGAIVLLVPFMFLQWWNFGVFTLSSNSAGDLFAASSPQFGRWSFEVEKVADAAGVTTIKDRYAFFMREARKNLRQHPEFFLGNVRRTTVQAWRDMQTLDVPGGWLTLIAALILAHGFIGERPTPSDDADAARRIQALSPTLAAALVAAAALAEAQRPGVAAPVLAGAAIVRALLLRPGDGVWLVVNYLAFTLLAVGMFAAVEPRLVLFVQWGYLTLVAVGAASVWQAGIWLLGGWRTAAARPIIERVAIGRPRWRLRLAAAAIVLAPLTVRNLIGAPPSREGGPDLAPALLLLDLAAAQRPSFFSQAEQTELAGPRDAAPVGGPPSPNWPTSVAPLMDAGTPESTDGKLIVLRGVFHRHVYRFDAGRGGNHLTKSFARRSYARCIVHFQGYTPQGSHLLLKVALPEPWSPPPAGEPWLLLARGNPELREYVHPTLEAIALAPAPDRGSALAPSTIRYFDEPAHVQLVHQLAAVVHAE